MDDEVRDQVRDQGHDREHSRERDRERDIEHRIIDNIGGLVAEERNLRNRSTQDTGLTEDERSRLRTVEVRLDQCWDLLRQRRALSEFGEDPSAAKVRPPDEVEGYRG